MAVINQTDLANMVARILGEESTGGALSASSEYALNRVLEDRIGSAAREVLAAGTWNFATKLTVLRTKAGIRTITGATAASPVVITYSGTDIFSNGDRVKITDVVGMTELNGNTYIVANVSVGPNTFELTDNDGDNIDGTAYTAYSSAGEARLMPAFGFDNAYDLPTDCVRIIDLNQGDAEPSEWEVVGTQIFTDLDKPELRYVSDISLATSAPDDSFNRSLALYLAWDLSPFVNQDLGRREQLYREYKESLSVSRYIDAAQHGQTYVKNNGALLARYGGAGMDQTKVWRSR